MSRCGLTLLELLVALAVVAILGSISVVSWARMRPGLAIAAAARQVAMELTLTRLRAISTGTNHRVLFPEGEPGYRLQRLEGATYRDLGTAIALPDGVRITECTATGDAVTFRPRGNASTFGTVSLENREGDRRQVVVDIAGITRVQ